MKFLPIFRCVALLLGLLAGVNQAFAEAPPKEIRLGSVSNMASDGQKHWGFALLGVAYSRALFEEEFKDDETTLKFVSLNSVPMVGEALASGQIDFAEQGALISLIGRSAGIQTRFLMPVSKLRNAYVAVKAGSPLKSIADLKGKRVAYMKGTFMHLQLIHILASNGLTEKDIRPVSLGMDPGTISTALATGDIDATISGPDMLVLRDNGVASILYSTQDGDVEATAQTGLIARDDFVSRYPQTTKRIVKVLVRAAQWASEDANRDQVIGPWWGYRLMGNIAEDALARPWNQSASPLFDPFLIAQYHDSYRLGKTHGLLRGKDFDVDQWMDSSFLNQVLAELKLENHWPSLDRYGALISSDER